MGFQKLQNKLAATANYYGAGRPVSKLTGACGARIKEGSQHPQRTQGESRMVG